MRAPSNYSLSPWLVPAEMILATRLIGPRELGKLVDDGRAKLHRVDPSGLFSGMFFDLDVVASAYVRDRLSAVGIRPDSPDQPIETYISDIVNTANFMNIVLGPYPSTARDCAIEALKDMAHLLGNSNGCYSVVKREAKRGVAMNRDLALAAVIAADVPPLPGFHMSPTRN